jgi:predicted dehydrogenase
MINLALVGFGRWGAKLVDSVQGRSDRVRFGSVVSRSPERVGADAQARGLAVHTRLEEVLADRAIDGVVLATPHSQHVDQVCACATAGKNVFVEKPFALTHASAQRAIAAAAAAGIVLAAGHNRRFLPALRRMKQLLGDGELGTLLHIETAFCGNAAAGYAGDHWRVAAGESPAGGLAGSGIHMIDAIIDLAGPIAEVAAFTARRVPSSRIDDTTSALFRLSCGATASLTNLAATVPVFRIQVFGSAGAAGLRDPRRLEIESLQGQTRTEPFAEADTERAELEAFADAIAGVSPYPVSSAEIANGIATFEAVCRAAETRRSVATGG